MPELRKDPIIDNWVIISTERGRRPLIDRRDACPTNFLVNWLIG
jgi:UDPglucose--hexose-1-phosphate uridylyltransferase